MSIVPSGNRPIAPLGPYDLSKYLLYHSYRIYYWLRDIAPILLKYQLLQLGRNAIDNLPYLSWETKNEIKRWYDDFYWQTQRDIEQWLENISINKAELQKEIRIFLDEVSLKSQEEIDHLLDELEDKYEDIRRWLEDYFG